MAYGQPPKKIDDFWHYPVEEEIKNVPNQPYKLPDYIISNLNSIEGMLKGSSEVTKKQLKEAFDYLDQLSNKVRDILQLEKSVGISNLELENHFRKIGQMLNQVSTLLERV